MVFVSQDRIQPPAAHPLLACPSATGRPGDFPPSPPKDILGEALHGDAGHRLCIAISWVNASSWRHSLCVRLCVLLRNMLGESCLQTRNKGLRSPEGLRK